MEIGESNRILERTLKKLKQCNFEVATLTLTLAPHERRQAQGGNEQRGSLQRTFAQRLMFHGNISNSDYRIAIFPTAQYVWESVLRS